MSTDPIAGPYSITMTLEAADDLDAMFSDLTRGKARTLWQAVQATMSRLCDVPHLPRVHHDNVRITALCDLPYHVWYVIDEAQRAVVLLGFVAATHERPTNGRPPGPWKKIWWWHMPYLPPRLPDPYSMQCWAAQPDWLDQEEWLAMVEAEAALELQNSQQSTEH